jgi:hypothetical protein
MNSRDIVKQDPFEPTRTANTPHGKTAVKQVRSQIEIPCFKMPITHVSPPPTSYIRKDLEN